MKIWQPASNRCHRQCRLTAHTGWCSTLNNGDIDNDLMGLTFTETEVTVSIEISVIVRY